MEGQEEGGREQAKIIRKSQGMEIENEKGE